MTSFTQDVSPLRVGLVGYGAIGRFYSRAVDLRPDLTLTAICDLDPDRVPEALRQRVPVFTHTKDFLSSGLVDAILVNIPNDQHFAVCHAALTAKVHVCCEKPLALNSQDADALEALAQAEDLVLLTSFHRRYNNRYLELLDTYKDWETIRSVTVYYCEKIEEHCGVDSWYLDPARCGGGCVADNGPNALDALMALVGPVELTGAAIEADERGLDIRARLDLTAGAVKAQVILDWGYADGELKGIVVTDASGHTVVIDYLQGFPGFKQSLAHEYEGVLDDFTGRISGSHSRRDSGCAPGGSEPLGAAVVRLVEEAYGRAVIVPQIDIGRTLAA